MKKKYIALFFSLILIIGCSDEADESTSESTTSITSAQAELRDLSASFSVSAEIEAYTRVYVASRMSGLIEEVHFEEGQHVNRGDLLAKLDVCQQQIELRRANATLSEAKDAYERTEQLYERDAATRAEYLTAQRDFEQAKSDVELLELMINFGSIRAPIDAVVTSRLVEVGNNVSENERMFTLADMDLLVVRPGVSERNLSHLEENQEVEIALDVYPDRTFTGSIRRIFPEADPTTRLFTVEVEIHQEEDKPTIRPGYLARTKFTGDQRDDVLTVPSEALADRNGKTYLFVVNDDETTVEMLPVEVGAQRGGYAEITSGIEEGKKVAASNLDALDDGTAIQVVGSFRRYGFNN